MALHAFNNAVSFGFTKSLPGWGIALLIVGSVAAVVSIGVAIARHGGTPSPAPLAAGRARTIGAMPDARERLVEELRAHALLIGEVTLTSAPPRSTTSTSSARSCGPRGSRRSPSWSRATRASGRRRPSVG